MKISSPPVSLGAYHPASLIATGCGVGLLPLAPGTWGSLAALPFAWLIVQTAGPWALFLAAIAAIAAGAWASSIYAKAAGVEDSQSIIVDEIAGQWITLIAVPLNPWAYLAAFALFRLFDITKPFPANWADQNVKGGFGVMLDDIIAGVYALIVMQMGLYAIRMM